MAKIKKTPFIPLFADICRQVASGELLKANGDKYSLKTADNSYMKSIPILEAFEAEHGIIYLQEINFKWFDKYRLFLQYRHLAKNTISFRISIIKAVMKRLWKDGQTNFSGTGVSTSTELTTAVYNTVAEIDELLALDFSRTPGMERVRDIYVMHCYIGSRFSDLKKMLSNLPAYIICERERYFFSIKTNKTGEVVTIPISSRVQSVMSRRKNDFTPGISYHYYNRTLKELAEIAGFTSPVICSVTRGGRREDTEKPKYALISSHTARRTFATNAYLAGVPILNIMYITGHKTVASFLRYIRCASLESALSVANHDFFK